MFQKVNPVHRSQLVTEQLIAKICNDQMQIGDKLPTEREIAKAMDVSRNTLREAIATLQLMGILEVRRSSGIFVAQLPPSDAAAGMQSILNQNMNPQAAIEARIAMEPGAAVLAAQAATDRDWKQLESLYETIKTTTDAGDVEAYRETDNMFHRAIASATHNELLMSALLPILDTVRQPLWRTMKQNIYDEMVLERGHAEHLQIFLALKSRDDYFIFRAVRQHLEGSKERLTSEFAEVERLLKK